MTSSVTQLCTICHDGGVSKEAITWCIECEVFFCGDCEKPHRMSRLFKNHKTISSQGYQELPSFMQEGGSQCRDHNKKFELYCPTHAYPCCAQCITDNHKKCQQMKPLSDILKEVKSPGIEQIKPSLMKRLTITDNIKSLNIWACFVLPNGKFIMFDYNQNRLLLFSIDGLYVREVVSFTEIPLDACLVRNDTVAVALGSSNQTALVDIEQNKTTQIVKLLHDCDAVASDGQTLVISDMVKSTKVNLNDMSHTILEGVRASRIAIFKENIYGTIYYENKVFCYTSTGEPLWTFQHHGINLPQGLTLDTNGFVYIASRGNNSIVVVSPDGKTSKTILSEADGIKNPYAIDINRETGVMIVSIERMKNSDSALVYKF
ncbi:unnamed protein product [Mytilus edulis]|uniref:B box-type domain-containing protein n=1 Tax=Mytilus edulis TaxID=6550 RepID=A0A8S3VEH1_MYTED|nr:unnamed protein product [Mytilus edulis]